MWTIATKRVFIYKEHDNNTEQEYVVPAWLEAAIIAFYRAHDENPHFNTVGRVNAIKLARGAMNLSLIQAKQLCDEIYRVHRL